MIKPVDYSFPNIYPSASSLFPVEISKLTAIWNACCRNFEENARAETEYKNDYQLLHLQGSALAGSTCAMSSGTACLVSGIYFQTPPIFLSGLATIGASIWAWINISDNNHQINHFIDSRITAHQTIEKIERCVRLINQVGELSAAFETAKKSPSDQSLQSLFKSFKHVQKAEVGLMTDSIDPVLPFLLMDDLVATSTPNLKILEEWKNFSEGRSSQLPEFKYFKATKAAYFNYIIKRVGTNPLQVDNKITKLKTYLDHALTTSCAF